MSQSDLAADQQAARAVVRHHSELAAALTGHATRLVDAAGVADAPQVWQRRDVPHGERHARVLAALDALPDGGALVLVAPHAPVPLLAEIESRYAGQVAGHWLQDGPDVWQIRLHRRPVPA